MGLRRPRDYLILLLVLAGVALGIEMLIETDLEALERFEDELVEALTGDDPEALAALLTTDFQYGTLDRDGALAEAARRRGTLQNLNIDMKLREIEIEGDTARAKAVFYGAFSFQRTRYSSRVEFVRGPDGWLLRRAEDVGY